MGRESIGEFERLVLLAVLRLGDEAYGAAILRELEERAGRTTSAGSVYVSLRRLAGKGMVEAETGEPTPGRGGRPPRFYTLTPAGITALREARAEWDAMTEGLGGVLGGGG